MPFTSYVRPLTWLILAAALALPVAADETRVQTEDVEGVDWVTPFEVAREASRTSGKMLLVKPVYFGVEPDTGKW